MQRPSSKKSPIKTEKTPAAALVDSSFTEILYKGLIIIMAGLFVAAPCFHGDWLWDDDQAITANAILPDPAGLVKIWTGAEGADYWPLTTSVHWLIYRVSKLDSTGYHLVNVFLHLMAGLLIWKLFRKLGIRYAWLGGLIFVIHPILVESVAWVSELKNTLSLPFMLLSMIAFINYDERKRGSDLAWSIGFYLLSILAKTSVVMFPFVLLLYYWWKHGNFTWKNFFKSEWFKCVLATIPFFLISLVMGLLTIHFQHGRAIGTETIPVGGMVSRTATAGMAILFYLWKCLLPIGLIPIYPRWEVDPPKIWQFFPWPVLAAAFFWFWTKRETWGKHLIFGLGFFVLGLIPILGFITMSYMRITWVADHFVYLPIVGVLGLVVAGIGMLYDWIAPHNKKAMLVVGCLALGVLTTMGHWYSGIFVDESAMWSYTLKHNANAWQAHSRYGKVKIDRGEMDAAFYHISEANRLRPDLAETHNNLAALLEQKDPDKALFHLREAYRIEPNLTVFRVNLANLLVRRGLHEEAMGHYVELLKTNPDNAMFHCNYGVTLYFMGRNEQAILEFQRALELVPGLKDAQENLKVALDKKYGRTSGTAAPEPAKAP